MDQRGFYIKKDNKSGNFQLFIHLDQFNAYMVENGCDQWNKFVIYENENDSGKYSHNIKLINNKERAND